MNSKDFKDPKRPQMTSEEPVIIDYKKPARPIKPITNKRNKLEDGDPRDITLPGSDLIEQTFSSS